MRIFYAVPRSGWVDLNLRRSLERMGHQVVPFTFPGWPDDADPAWQSHGKPRTNEALLKAFRRARDEGGVDLFYGYLYSSVAYPETIDQVRASGVPTVNFTCNNVPQFDLVREIAPHFDVSIVPERAAVERFRQVGARPLRIQLAANPEVYRPYPEPRRYDVTFVGQRYADRAAFLTRLYQQGVRVRAWGAGWQARKRLTWQTTKAGLALIEDERWDGVSRIIRQRLRRKAAPPATVTAETIVDTLDTSAFGGPRLLQRDLIRMFSQSRVSLGFATSDNLSSGPRRRTHLRLREFEAPMSGALYLTEYQPELDEYFEVGKEVLCYRDPDDLLEQVRYYLARPEEAERVRRAGYRRALGEHTWQHRFRDLFAALGLRD